MVGVKTACLFREALAQAGEVKELLCASGIFRGRPRKQNTQWESTKIKAGEVPEEWQTSLRKGARRISRRKADFQNCKRRNMPKVSIIMSAYNSALTLNYTLAALPNSTLRDWEAVIVNDASEDSTGDQLEAFAAHDRRVRVLHNSENLGLAASLNRTIDAAQSPYLARLDADDILLPDRLAQQATYLDSHPYVGALGMGANTINGAGRLLGYKSPIATLVIPWAKLWRVPFIHPTVMLRRKVLEDNGLRYDADFLVAQDFELWSRLLHFTDGANLNRPGILYRVHSGQATNANIDRRLDFHREVSRRHLENIIQTPICDTMLEAQRGYFLGEHPRGGDIPDLYDALRWREMVAGKMLSDITQKSIAIGLGFDLWHILRNRSLDNRQLEILSTKSRRKCLTKSAPLLAKQLALTQFWKRRSRLAKR